MPMSATADSVSLPLAIDVRPESDQALNSVEFTFFGLNHGEGIMGRGILLWMLGVPLPIILLLAMCSHR